MNFAVDIEHVHARNEDHVSRNQAVILRKVAVFQQRNEIDVVFLLLAAFFPRNDEMVGSRVADTTGKREQADNGRGAAFG